MNFLFNLRKLLYAKKDIFFSVLQSELFAAKSQFDGPHKK